MDSESIKKTVLYVVIGVMCFVASVAVAFWVGKSLSRSQMRSFPANNFEPVAQQQDLQEIPVKPEIWIDEAFSPWESVQQGVKNFELNNLRLLKIDPIDNGYRLTAGLGGSTSQQVVFEVRGYFTSVDMATSGDYEQEIAELPDMFVVGDTVRVRGLFIPADSQLTAEIARASVTTDPVDERYTRLLGDFGGEKISVEKFEALFSQGTATLPTGAILVYGFDKRQ